MGCITLTELAVTRPHCIEYADLETPCGLALAHGGHASGGTSLGGANFLLSLGQLIRFRDSECLIQDRQAQQRVIRRVLRAFGSAEDLGSMVYRVTRLCGAGVSPQVMAHGEDP